MSTAPVNYRVEQHTAIISFNNPPLNVLTQDMLDAYIGYLEQARQDDTVRSVIITSDVPGRFCAGLDLNALYRGEKTGGELVERLYVRIAEAQYRLGKPSIAAVNGTARGGGMTLSIGCDVIVCADTATFGYPEIFSGILPSIHFYHLPPIVGKHRAFELLFSGRSFDSTEAQTLGLVSGVYPESELHTQALAVAASFNRHSPEVVRFGRTAFKQACESSYLADVQNAANNFAAISARPDALEGISAFIEKRDPYWRE